MTSRFFILAVVFICALLGMGYAAAADKATAPIAADTTPRLVRFKAFLFNRDTGTFSTDVLARDDKNTPVELANVIGGAFASDSTFVSIEVRAPAGDIVPAGTRIRVKAIDTDEVPFAAKKRTARPKVLIDKTVQTRRVNAGARTVLGFWLPSTGCAPVKLSAEFVGIRNASKLADTIAFVCHE